MTEIIQLVFLGILIGIVIGFFLGVLYTAFLQHRKVHHKDWLSDKNSSIKQNTRKYQLQQKLAVSDADQSIIEAKKKTGRKQTENEVREEERKKGIVNFKN